MLTAKDVNDSFRKQLRSYGLTSLVQYISSEFRTVRGRSTWVTTVGVKSTSNVGVQTMAEALRNCGHGDVDVKDRTVQVVQNM